jgi:predicted permease
MPIRRLVEDTIRDLRYAARMLSRSPIFSLVAICSLAIGIGGAASVFTVLNAVVLRNLPVPRPTQLVRAEKVTVTRRQPRFSWPQFEDARRELQGKAELTAFISAGAMNVRIDGGASARAPERALVQLVSGEFFQVLRQQPQLGRVLSANDNVTLGGHPFAVISDRYWARQFRRTPDVVGKTLIVNEVALTIVGVAAPGFFGPILSARNPDVWVPLMMQSAVRYASNASNDDESDPRRPWPPQRGIEWLNVIARIPDANEVGAASTILTTLVRRDLRSRTTNPDEEAIRRIDAAYVELVPAARGVSFLREEASSPLLVLLGMVGVLLAIACGNVASLLIARGSARDREIAIRLSIGAGRGRVTRQLLVETLVLAFAGGALGLLVAAWARDLLLAMFVPGATIIDLDTGFDWRVVGFAVAVTAVSGILAGIGPALRGTRVLLAESMKGEGRVVQGHGGRRGQLVGKALVAAQISFSLLLLVLATLFARSMQSLMRVDVGYDRDQVLVGRLDVQSMGLAPAERQALYARVLDRLTTLPGVRAASLSLNGPLGTSQRTSSLGVEGYTPEPSENLVTREEVITERYFETVGLHIVEGRGFRTEDRLPGARTTIINETMAKRFFANGSALGRRWNYGDPMTRKNAWTIIGVVRDAKYTQVRGPLPNMVYHLAAANPDDVLANLELRTVVPHEQIVSTVRKTLAETESSLPVYDVMPLAERMNRGLANDRLVANLTAIFAGIALLLACLGLYGTISYGVARRIRELGVRMALGAARNRVLWLVIREAMILIVAGATLGVPLAFAAGRGVGSLLFGVGPLDVIAYATAAGLLMLVGGVAAFIPAHRASRIDPMAALRAE